MRKLIVFNHMSLDGYFTDSKGDMSFAQNPVPDAEWDAFVAGNASGGGIMEQHETGKGQHGRGSP
jgi:hypothetical protein